MRYSQDGSSISDSADQQRMADFIEACQAAVDAWDLMEVSDLLSIAWQDYGDYSQAEQAARRTGAARARARIAMHTADGLL